MCRNPALCKGAVGEALYTTQDLAPPPPFGVAALSSSVVAGRSSPAFQQGGLESAHHRSWPRYLPRNTGAAIRQREWSRTYSSSSVVFSVGAVMTVSKVDTVLSPSSVAVSVAGGATSLVLIIRDGGSSTRTPDSTALSSRA